MGELTSIGEFEELVLLAVLRIGDEAYGTTILDEIRQRTGRKVLRPAVYVALRRLEQKGLVQSREAPPTAGRGGRARRVVRLEGAGLEALQRSRQARLGMWDGFEAILDEG